ncbi:MAG: VCBS repeat-containing protein [Pseudomonadales bacterium]|nr:VCBS repeat-containing protein [Pseudomonadales bacterium]
MKQKIVQCVNRAFVAGSLMLGVTLFGANPVDAANIVITTGAGFSGSEGTSRLAVFQAAADYWETQLDIAVDVSVYAEFTSLTCSQWSGTLGSAGPTSVTRDWSGVPESGTWYAYALAFNLKGYASGTYDIDANFNDNVAGDINCLNGATWYYGTDGNPGVGEVDLYTTVLHELGHGLGFLTFVNTSTGALAGGYTDVYTNNLLDGSTGKLWNTMSNAERQASAIDDGDLMWNGSKVNALTDTLDAGTASGKVLMYAPTTLSSGSSVSHFDTSIDYKAAYGSHELMEYLLENDTNHILTVGLFCDIGWGVLRDTDGDGTNDCDDTLPLTGASYLLTRSTSAGTYAISSIASGAVSSTSTLSIPATYTSSSWDFEAFLDSDGDGDKDILLSNNSTGNWRIITLENGAYVSNAALWMDSHNNYTVVDTGDFDNDGDDDVLMKFSGGTYQMNVLQSSSVSSKTNIPLYGGDYVVQGVGDFDNDGDEDVMMRRTSTGKYRLFSLQNAAVSGSQGIFPLYSSSDYVYQGAGDFDADGDDDVLLRSTSTGNWRAFFMESGGYNSDAALAGIYTASTWEFQTATDPDFDGDDDVLLRNTSTGAWRKFVVESGAVSSNASFGLSTSLDDTLAN